MTENTVYTNESTTFRIIWILAVIVITGYLYFLYKPYLSVSESARHLDMLHRTLKPSGNVGHALGVLGAVLMVLCYLVYILRKKIEGLECLGSLSLWLEIHIFLGILGPILVFFHTAMKFNGIIGFAFWLMVIVVVSGIFGRAFFGQCFWNITKKFELLHDIDIFLEKNLRDASENSAIVKRVMELRPPGFPNNYGVLRNLRQWSYIRKEATEIFGLIDKHYGNKEYEEYPILQKWATSLVKRLREIRYISLLDLYLSILNKWVIIHKVFSYVLFFFLLLHVFVTVYWGYRWIL